MPIPEQRGELVLGPPGRVRAGGAHAGRALLRAQASRSTHSLARSLHRLRLMHRELNEIEYFNWCVGQPYNMVVAVQVRGRLRPDRLRSALDKVQQRHPLLGVNTEIGAGELPWFSSEGVGPIPLTIVQDAEADAPQVLAEGELTATFARDHPQSSRLPLMRVSLLLARDSSQPASLVFTAQHVIADGLSMVFLVRDLLRFIEDPDAAVEVLDAPARPDDLLPPRVRR